MVGDKSLLHHPVSTHSRPKAAGSPISTIASFQPKFQHTAARRRLDTANVCLKLFHLFQHTAARRRLVCIVVNFCSITSFQHTAARRRLVRLTRLQVSSHEFQHTAARRRLGCVNSFLHISFYGFNTQPPEGGWSLSQKPCSIRFRSPNFAKLPRKAEMRV